MASERLPEQEGGPHRRPGPHRDENRTRLRELGRTVPETADVRRSLDGELARRLLWYVAWLVVAVLVAGGAYQALEPVPRPALQPRISARLRPRGALARLPWPAVGEAAVYADGMGSLGSDHGARRAPISSLAMVMTALVVLRDHPIPASGAGPTLEVTAPVVAAERTEAAEQATVVPVTLGEQLTERQALEALLVAQGDDIAVLLADWDAGDVPKFVARMNADARAMGLTSTSFADPDGLDPSTVSSPENLVRLGDVAMSIPTFAEIVAMPQVDLPLAGLVYSFDYDVTHDGVVGVETGASAAAGGCFLFVDQRVVGDQRLTLVGAVLGQEGVSTLTTALSEGETLVDAAFAALRAEPTPFEGDVVGDVVGAWGAQAPVRATTAVKEVYLWPGLTVPLSWHTEDLRTPLAKGASVGVLTIGLGVGTVRLSLHTLTALTGPSVIWRITRV